MCKNLFLFACLLSAFSQLHAFSGPKVDIEGYVLDSGLVLPLEFATISAFDLQENLITGASTDSTGYFKLKIEKGAYNIKIEYIGYEALDTLIDLRKDLNLGNILLTASAQLLDEAVVTAERSRLSLRLDKQIFDVGADIVSQGGTANEVLDNVPMVNVSPEGIVSLRGNSGVKVLINGKPSALADNNALQGIPASNIDKVEVMTNPSAKYEAEGSAGIINIILKDEKAKSLGGQVSVSVAVSYTHLTLPTKRIV